MPVTAKRKNRTLPESEIALIGRALDGDQRAYTELTQRFSAAVFQIVFKIVRDRETAADLVQETFMKAFSSLASYRSEFRFSTWLYKIAANSSIDHLRKKRIQALSLDRKIETKDGSVEIQIPDYSYHPGQTLERKEQRNFIEEAINSLPAKYREVIVYRHKEDKSYEEIADQLSIPVGTVKARIFRARELLKKKLKDAR